MPSPFPGMNPYLEQDDVCQDFHPSFLIHLRERLAQQIAPTYFVKVEEHLFVHELPAEQRRFMGRADVAVQRGAGTQVEANPGHALAINESAVALMDAPAHGIVPEVIELERQPYLEIRDRLDRQVVTVIELLSPSNKYAGTDREQYLAKRRRLLFSRTHLVEIDLLRGGPRLPVEGLPTCDYSVLVSRSEERPRAGLWPIALRSPLPTIPIPLRAPDPDASLDLQAVLHRVYDSAGYGVYVYQGEPQPALEAGDAEWARQFVPEKAG